MWVRGCECVCMCVRFGASKVSARLRIRDRQAGKEDGSHVQRGWAGRGGAGRRAEGEFAVIAEDGRSVGRGGRSVMGGSIDQTPPLGARNTEASVRGRRGSGMRAG